MWACSSLELSDGPRIWSSQRGVGEMGESGLSSLSTSMISVSGGGSNGFCGSGACWRETDCEDFLMGIRHSLGHWILPLVCVDRHAALSCPR